ncbi:MAG: metal-dependent hydrolase [Bacteroidales bacterium]|nr:metal-dependent hydrolase [Bacteroidales bacterium]
MKALVKILPILLACACTGLLGASCDKENPKKENGGKEDEKVEDIQVIDGKVTFFVDIDSKAPSVAMGVKNAATKVLVNGKECTIKKDDKGRRFVEAAASASGNYTAVLVNVGSQEFYGASASSEVKLPHAQYYKTTVSDMKSYPMYSAYSKETGNKLIFKDGFAVLDLALTGSATITSVKVSNPMGGAVAGVVNYTPSKEKFTPSKCIDFAVLNCTDGGKGVKLSSTATHFPVMIVPGTYAKGLDVTVCDAARGVMRFNVAPGEITGNAVISETREYKCDDNVLYYNGFDTFVWGGDLAYGEEGYGFSPETAKPGIDDSKALNGDENAFNVVPYDYPGTGFFQSNTWDQVNPSSGFTPANSHQMTEAYIKSRSLDDCNCAFRCQERPGYIEVGAGNSGRGIFWTGKCLNVAEISNAKVSFDVFFMAGFNDDLLFQVYDGGYITDIKVNGVSLNIKQTYTSNVGAVVAGNKSFTLTSNAAAPKTWNKVEVTLERVTTGTSFYFAGNSSASMNHGFYLDNIELTQTEQMQRAANNLRVLYWNIQNGMWSDQANAYANFKKWVKKYNPDVCVWCESVTIYKDGTSTGIGNSGSTYKGYFPNGWTATAAAYGHSYYAIGGTRDNYPQVVTSKYPITTIKKITNTDVSSKPIAHGAGLHSITVGGKTIYIATLHTWPQAYGFGVSSANQSASAAANEGDYYREYEMNYVVSATMNASEYASQKDWLFMGDFNSRSRLDNGYYKYADNDTKLLCQDVLLNKTNMVDIIGKKYEGDFIASTYGNARIDYMFASPSMYSRVKNAMIIIDDWTIPHKDNVTSFIHPSDHRPILVDFDLSK